MSTETALHVRCPHCQTAFRALPEHAGRRAKCSHCGGTIVVPGEPANPPEVPADVPQPQYVGVNCMLCGTRMYGTLAEVGKELKCPDCGRLTKLPPPEIKKKQMPAALEGEQYELWDGDDQPWGVTLSAEGPRFIAVECRLCQTHLQATLDLIGKTIRCPDCNAETEVRLPAKGVRAKKPTARAADEYEVDDSIPPVVAPSFYFPTADESEPTSGAAPRPTPGKSTRDEPLDAEFKERPKLPRWPLMTGNVSFFLTPGVRPRWIVMSSTLLCVSLIAAAALATLSTVSGGIPGAPTAIAGMLQLVAAVVIALIWSTAMAAMCLAIVTDSAEGNDQVHAWPSANFIDWFPELGVFLIALMTSAFPGWLVGKLMGSLAELGPVYIGLSVLVCLPITVLSQLAANSAWAVLSPPVLASWFRCPLSWIGFYLHAAAAVSLTLGTVLLSINVSAWFLLLVAPLAVAAIFYYFRVMGRLAWVIAESTPVAGDEDEAENK